MEFNEESFKTALNECKIIRWENHFKDVVKAYLKAESKQCNIADVVERSEQFVCEHNWKEYYKQMKETRFKTLMHCGMYVDANLLEKGIYSCSKPYLYNMDETIETMIAKAEKVQDMMGKHHISDKYFESLKQCQMVQLFVTEAYVSENSI